MSDETSYNTNIANLAETFHHILGADHVLCDDAPKTLGPLFSALLIVHHANFSLLKVFRICWYVAILTTIHTLTKITLTTLDNTNLCFKICIYKMI